MSPARSQPKPPVSPAEAAANEALVRRFVQANQDKDTATMLSLIAENIFHEMPFSETGRTEPGAIRSHNGKAEMTQLIEMAVTKIEQLKFIDPDFSLTANGRTVFMEAYGDCRMADGKIYRNRYVFRFDVEGGKIVRMREYYNPIVSGYAFERPIAGRFKLDSLEPL